MLESFAASLLTKYLGQYVTGFSKDNLSFSIGTGNAVLENLELKKDALDELDLPITVKGGKYTLIEVDSPSSFLSWSNYSVIVLIIRIFGAIGSFDSMEAIEE